MLFARLRALATCALLALSACATPPPPPADADLYVNMTLLDPATQTRTANSYILVSQGRILAVGRGEGPEVAAERRHDMGGAYALPGLIDTHAHVTLGRLSVRVEDGRAALVAASEDEITEHNARLLVAMGVTTIRNPGGATDANARYARRVASGELIGPTALAAGEILDATPFEGLAIGVTDDASIEAAVAYQAEAGMQYVKLYQLLTEAQIEAGIAAARRHRMRTIIHTNGVNWERASALGIDSIVHAMPISPDLLTPENRARYRGPEFTGGKAFYQWWELVDLDGPEMRSMIAELARRRVTVDLTLVLFQKQFWGDDPGVRDHFIDYTHPGMRENWRTFRFDIGWTQDDYTRARAVWPKIMRFARMLYEAGVPLTIGTDLANPFVAPGADVHTEMRLYQDAGIPSWAVLRMATNNAAETLGLDESIGRLSPGYEADIVFTLADPSRDVANIENVSGVLLNGVRYETRGLIVGRP
ncbi:MAG: amidohydrolase family protein [Hyphomonadaceae bacterium]|nr:amidohydrolase family protein [Hyphomonadaceae bacterium]